MASVGGVSAALQPELEASLEQPEVPAVMSSTRVSSEHRLLIDLCLQHLVVFLWQGPGLLLISRKRLSAVLDDLANRGIPVVGLEGFELDDQEVHPRLDLIFDADRLPGFPTPREAIETWRDDVWVDVTIGNL